ncbi:MAG: hypothetical protein LCI00_10640 [Chloroflexi bacterium]|nr:hypothetical protein [Chloroflexota bacterium]MCC6892104.1 hypothetical protein [Anaerolineae bacterium]
MNEYYDDGEFAAVLAQCMEDVQRQYRTLDECLQTYPQYAERLKPLLLTGMITARLKRPQLSKPSAAAIEKRLRAEMQPQVRRSTRRTSAGYGLRRLAAVLVIALFLAVGSGAGLVSASSNTLPGDSLYGIKRLWEAIILALSPLTGPQDVLWQRIAETRLDEIERLAAEDRLTETALVDFYGALYHISGFSSTQTDPKVMALMQDATSSLLEITPPAEAEAVYADVLRLTQENVRTGVISQPPDELPDSIIQLTALPTLFPSATATMTFTATGTSTATALPSATAVLSATGTFTASATATVPPSATPTPSRTPRIPATATKTLTPLPTLTETPTATITPTATWTDLPLPTFLLPMPATAMSPATSAFADPTDTPEVIYDTEVTRVRATYQSVYMTQTALAQATPAP